jgi:pyrimidine deaminase RibD-like protein
LDKTAIRPSPSLLTEERCTALLQELALEAQAFRFDVAPKPCVGAAVLSGDRVIARGFHEVWG